MLASLYYNESAVNENNLAYNLDEAVGNIIYAAMDKSGGNGKRAAELLGIDRSTLWRKLKEMNYKK